MSDSRLTAWEAARDTSGRALHATCYAPFVSLEFDTQGYAYSCCANGTYPVGSVATSTLAEIWGGARLAAQREALRGGDLSYGCSVCRWYFDHDRPSPPAVMYESFAVDGDAPSWPSSMAFAFSNRCNLQCIQCSGEYSSSIRIHREGRPPLPQAYGSRFFDELRAFLPHLEEIRLLGGEPFLVPETFQLFGLLGELDLTPRVHVTTNGTRLDDRIEAAFARFPLSVSLSLDAVSAPALESIRVGASAPVVLANARRLASLAHSSGGNFGINYCLMRQNWDELPAVLRFGEELGAWVSVIPVYGDDHSFYKLDKDGLRQAAASLWQQDEAMRSALSVNLPVWEAELAQIRAAAEAEGDAPAPMLEPTRHDNTATFVQQRRAIAATEVAGPPPRWWRRRSSAPGPDPVADPMDELIRWAVGGSVVSVETDHQDLVTSVATALGTPPSVDPGSWVGRPFGELAEDLRLAWGRWVWLVEEDRSRPGLVDQLVAFSPAPDREKRGMVVRVVSLASPDGGWRTYLAVDPSFYREAEPATGPPLGGA